jgi:MoaA/NifB/PqqE/SkfB family radical SAM enzyme
MRNRDKIRAGLGLVRVRLGATVPVAARINLNNRCHSKCSYCSFWHTHSDELTTAEVLSVISQLADAGTRRLSLSGGEPMLRGDLGEIIDGAVDVGLSVGLNSSGYLFRKRRAALHGIDLAKLSLDGPRALHDDIRGREGAYDELLDAIAVCEEDGHEFSFAMTMTSRNLDAVPWVLDFARERNTFVAFQPIMAHQHADDAATDLYPTADAMQRTMQWLIDRKRTGEPAIRTSVNALEHARQWPVFGDLHCWAGKAFVMVEADGTMLPCDRIEYATPAPHVRDGVATALANLPSVQCAGCAFCGATELNLMLAGRPDVLPGVRRVLGG